ncbi:hypothetical protein O1611_g4595 [Lasiodiplodia mahajangana]|uniref:Uncharacterized protein n=1 Tax=Lasiodiplodia mahajangana TaxID=1108764 RepID=A0ACC2JNE5_9PEZI|nr:hypothetical protein O1611_g4595 [Lasiodiplodia mahajangana]
MATNSGVQYVRLRSVGPSTSTSMDHETPIIEEDTTSKGHRSLPNLGHIRLKKLILPLSLLLNCLVIGRLLFHPSQREHNLTYSPALPAISNERVVFSSAFGVERSAFQGEPSEENNRLWAGLYDCDSSNPFILCSFLTYDSVGISRITADEARPMDNKTLPIPGDKGGYVVQLAVFHQLHCLNMIRKALYDGADMSNTDDSMGIEHLDHCVDMLRQSIMCTSDVTPTTFARTSLESSMKVVAEVVHTCRSFSKVQQWAWNRRIEEPIDKDTIVTDDPLGWGTYTFSP